MARFQFSWFKILFCFLLMQFILWLYNMNIEICDGNGTSKKSLLEIHRDREKKLLRNLPISELTDPEKYSFWKDRQNECGSFPRFADIKFTNTYWQKLDTNNGTVMLHGAYYDDRIKHLPNVWVIGGGREANRLPQLFCHLWFNSTPNPVEVKVGWSQYLHGKNYFKHDHPEIFLGHLIQCPIPTDFRGQIPSVVSMVPESCGSSFNALKITNKRPVKKQDFAICLKCQWSPFDENHLQMAEWIEMNLALGVSSIQIYIFSVAPKTREILDYYEKLGVVEVFPMEWVGSMPTSATPWSQQWFYRNVTWISGIFDQFVYNDCFHRNIYSYKFMSLIDLDELIMPVLHSSWQEMFKALKAHGADPDDFNSILFRHYYFFGNQTSKELSPFKIIDADLRTTIEFPKGWQKKGMFNTRAGKIVFNHYQLGCIYGSCQTLVVDPTLARLNHYRANCVMAPVLNETGCNEMKATLVQDNLAQRFGDRVKANVNKALASIQTRSSACVPS